MSRPPRRERLRAPATAAGLHEPTPSELAELLDRELASLAERLVEGLPPARSLLAKALIDESYVRLALGSVKWKDLTHFLAAAVRTMHCVLLDHLRATRRLKRGGEEHFLPLDESLVAVARGVIDPLVLEEALRRFAELDPLVGKAIELHFFQGFTLNETAAALSISRKALARKWASAIGALRAALSDT